MKILLSSHYAEQYRGTEMFNWTLAKYLSLKHDVSFFTFSEGLASEAIFEYAKKFEQPFSEHFDLFICSHRSCYEAVGGFCKKTAFISHGIVSSFDIPPEGVVSFGVSEEVKETRGCNFVIRNPIDFERFSPENGVKNSPIYMNSEPQQNIIKAIQDTGLNISIGGSGGKVWDIENIIKNAKYVLSTGRGVLEAMACKTPAIVVGKFGLDGYSAELRELAKHNFSGRRYKKDITGESLFYEIDKINKKDTERCYQFVRRNCDPNEVIKFIMENTL